MGAGKAGEAGKQCAAAGCCQPLDHAAAQRISPPASAHPPPCLTTPPPQALAFDPDCNGRFGLPEVTMLTLSLLSAKQIFAAFDPQGSGRVNLDFSQFVYAASQTR